MSSIFVCLLLFLIQVVPSFSVMSSCHLLLGRPLDLFPLLGCHSVHRLVHLLSFNLAIWPAHFHFCFSVYSMISMIFVLFLIYAHYRYAGLFQNGTGAQWDGDTMGRGHNEDRPIKLTAQLEQSTYGQELCAGNPNASRVGVSRSTIHAIKTLNTTVQSICVYLHLLPMYNRQKWTHVKQKQKKNWLWFSMRSAATC